MPQLQIGDFAPQLIWLAITFVILYIAMSRVALPRIGQVLEERNSRIQNDLREARSAQEKAEKAAADYDSALAEARARASASIRARRDRLDRELEAEKALKERQIAERMALAEQDIEASRQKSLTNVSAIAADTVGDIVRQVAGLEVSSDDIAEALRGSQKAEEPVS